MARKLVVEVVLDAAAYSRQIKKAEAQTAGFATNLRKTGRETVAASANLKGLGRSVAFATGGFVAFHSAADFVRESVDAAREAAVAQRALAAQMKASGESFQQNRQRIEEVARSYARFGFQNDEVIQSLTVLERGTGDINKAISLQGLTADLARAKNLELAQAAQTVAKVFGGQETALRRAVPGLDKNAHGLDLIREAQQKLAGQAAANTTASERFQATLHDTQEIVGKALLPSLNKLLESLTKYLTKMNQSDKLQKDVAASAGAAGDAFALLAKGIAIATDNYRKWRDLTGAGGKDPGFFSKLFGGTLKQQIDDFISRAKYLGGAANKYAEALGIIDKANAKVVAPAGALGPTGLGGVGAPAGARGPVGTTRLPAPFRATAEQRNTWFDQMIGRRELRAGLLTSAAAQLAAYKAIGASLTAQIAAVHDVTRKLNLKDQALQVAATVAGLEAQIAADLKQKQDDAAQKLKDQIAAAKQEHEDWLDFAYEKAQTTKTIRDDVKTARAALTYWKHQAATGKYTVDEARKVLYWQQELKNLRKQGRDADPLAGLMQVSSARLATILAAGTGLGARGRAILGANIAGAEIQPLHVHVNIDGREVGRAVTADQARTGRRTASQTSGRRG